MELSSFEKQINSTILQRGKVYYQKGQVESLEETEDGVWSAAVTGSDDYFVEIGISKKGFVNNYECDCPFDSDLCKHVVAVLYAIRDEKAIAPEDVPKTTKKKTKLSFQKLLDNISSDELKAFIVQYSKKNKSFKSDFELFFAEKDENFDIEKQIKDQIRKAIKTYSKHEFIDYGSSGKLARELEKILMQGQYYLSQKNFLYGSLLCMIYIQEVMPVITYADDSNGYLGDAIDSGISLLTDIAVQSPVDLKQKIATYLNKVLQQDLYFDYGNFGYDMTDLYAQLCLDLSKIDDFMNFADAAIYKARLDHYDYRSSFFIQIKASILQNGNRIEEAQQLMEQQIHLPKVRKIQVEKAIENGRFEEAKELLAEGIRLAEEAQHPGIIRDWEEILLHIAVLENDIQMVRFFTEKFAIGYSFNSHYYNQWKNTYTPKEWKSIINNKINSIRAKATGEKSSYWKNQDYWLLNEIGPIYIEENMFDKLLAIVQRQTDLETILNYHDHLYKLYPSQLMNLYSPLLDQQAESANKRSAYQRFMDIVFAIFKDIPSGRETLLAQMLHWKMIYRHRPAMMEELTNIMDKINVQGR
ncbi:SWIM zinc finger domain-containing protein [Sphingobacterium sp. G1-14]|uniref:SWIM zinc finger family protein n=1 Tax=Sphingobacterium sp. G1-14 TaxID=2003121 RepID=UPI0012FD6999|nr:SWIM zinc finger family protein [Sphingobacterium sp. G1-14]